MARLQRFTLPGQPQHVIVRGNNRTNIFKGPEDYQCYLEKLVEACAAHQCDLHAYVLMSNHVHLLMTPKTEQGIGKAMQSLGRSYVRYFNDRHRRSGTLWEGRYRATLIESERYLLTCCRYIELNPVRAGMATHPSKYQWSSYRVNALGRDEIGLTPHIVYRRLGKTPKDRCQAYRALFKHRLGADTLTEIREATHKAWVLGDANFKKRMEQRTGRPAGPQARGGDRKSEAYREKHKIKGL